MSHSNGRISVEVLLFARAVELVGCKQVRLDIPVGWQVCQLKEQLVTMYPALASIAEVSRWAVDAEFVAGDYVLEEAANVALIPPVSGG